MIIISSISSSYHQHYHDHDDDDDPDDKMQVRRTEQEADLRPVTPSKIPVGAFRFLPYFILIFESGSCVYLGHV